MTGHVIQGFFVGGRMRRPATFDRAQPSGPMLPSTRWQAHNVPGQPRPAIGAGVAAQAHLAPGRPPLAHPAAQPVQRSGGDDRFEIDPAQVGLVRSGGLPLPQALLAKMETAFQADFSSVRVHIGPQASRIGAIAFTSGNDLYFAPGQFQPESIKGQQLIGHELAHVIQQRQGRVRAPVSGVAVVQDRILEAEADRLGMRAAQHRSDDGNRGAIQRKASQPASAIRIQPPTPLSDGGYRVNAYSGGRQVGSLTIRSGKVAAAHVTDLSVEESHRNQGIGRMLIVSAAQASQRFGKARLSLDAQDSGTGRLTRWYQDMGFSRVGTNHLGYPRMEAGVGRLANGAVQRRPGAGVGGFGFAPVQRSSAAPKPDAEMAQLNARVQALKGVMAPHCTAHGIVALRRRGQLIDLINALNESIECRTTLAALYTSKGIPDPGNHSGAIANEATKLAAATADFNTLVHQPAGAWVQDPNFPGDASRQRRARPRWDRDPIQYDYRQTANDGGGDWKTV